MRTSRERKPKGSRRWGALALAVMVGTGAGLAAWKAPELGPPSFEVMLLAIVLAIVAGALGRLARHRTPFDYSARLPWRLTVLPRERWTQRLFLGWSTGCLGERRWAVGTEEDSVGVVGPPRVNKTAGSGIPQVLLWAGSLISVAPKPQVLRATAGRRQLRANQHGGRVLIYSPTEDGRVEGVIPVRFSPASSTSPRVVKLRVDSWTQAAATGRKVEDADHWKAGAGRVLRGCFLAAAHHRVRPGDFTLVREWVTARQLAEPNQILRDQRTFAADKWAEELEGVQSKTAERERDSFFSAAETTIAATSDPAVLRSTMATDFDPEQFLLSRSSLYIVAPTEHQKAVAPLISMLLETLVHTAYWLHREGRLEDRLLLSLDDLANCCPLPSLESIISQGGGQGVNVAWSLQSLAQLRDHYGVDQAEAIWSATRCKVVFGGLIDEQSLERLSNALGEERVRTRGETEAEQGRRQSVHESWRRRLSVGQLREIPDRWSVLIYNNLPPRMLRQPVAHRCHQLSRLMVRWVPEEAGAVASVLDTQPAEKI